jgi:hypothetical protein
MRVLWEDIQVYRLISENIEKLLGRINREDDVELYQKLLKRVRNTDVTVDIAFQRDYRRYWALNQALLSSQFYTAYFGYLEQHKADPNVSVESVARHLYAVVSHGSGRRSLQFSFSTKLVHMLCPDKPIYDSTVAEFYFLPNVRANATLDEKLGLLLTSYRFLADEYLRVLQQGMLADAISRFRERFHVGQDYSDRKVIDTLIWQFVPLIRSGEVIYGGIGAR